MLNPAGIAHGGFLVALLDDAAGLACASTYPRFVPQLTVELRSDFVRPVVAGVRHRVIGEVVRHGRSSPTWQTRGSRTATGSSSPAPPGRSCATAG